MSRLTETMIVVSLIVLAYWAGSDLVVNGKEVLLLLGVALYVAWARANDPTPLGQPS